MDGVHHVFRGWRIISRADEARAFVDSARVRFVSFRFVSFPPHQLSASHRERATEHLKRFAREGVVTTAHAETLRAAATGAGLDPVAVDEALNLGARA